jgi:hypothetical protein
MMILDSWEAPKRDAGISFLTKNKIYTLNIKEDITIYESNLISQMMSIGIMASREYESIDWDHYIKKYKLKKHFNIRKR